jgi:hypothetical protein
MHIASPICAPNQAQIPPAISAELNQGGSVAGRGIKLAISKGCDYCATAADAPKSRFSRSRLMGPNL